MGGATPLANGTQEFFTSLQFDTCFVALLHPSWTIRGWTSELYHYLRKKAFMMPHGSLDLDGGMGQMKTRTLQDHAASPNCHDLCSTSESRSTSLAPF